MAHRDTSHNLNDKSMIENRKGNGRGTKDEPSNVGATSVETNRGADVSQEEAKEKHLSSNQVVNPRGPNADRH